MAGTIDDEELLTSCRWTLAEDLHDRSVSCGSRCEVSSLQLVDEAYP